MCSWMLRDFSRGGASKDHVVYLGSWTRPITYPFGSSDKLPFALISNDCLPRWMLTFSRLNAGSSIIQRSPFHAAHKGGNTAPPTGTDGSRSLKLLPSITPIKLFITPT